MKIGSNEVGLLWANQQVFPFYEKPKIDDSFNAGENDKNRQVFTVTDLWKIRKSSRNITQRRRKWQ